MLAAEGMAEGQHRILRNTFGHPYDYTGHPYNIFVLYAGLLSVSKYGALTFSSILPTIALVTVCLCSPLCPYLR